MKKPTTGLEARVERVCAEMLAFSMLLIFCSLGFSYHIGLQANSVETSALSLKHKPGKA